MKTEILNILPATDWYAVSEFSYDRSSWVRAVAVWVVNKLDDGTLQLRGLDSEGFLDEAPGFFHYIRIPDEDPLQYITGFELKSRLQKLKDLGRERKGETSAVTKGSPENN